ncbi:hypothetical protein [Halomontanus rarus]|uniref:hypothetical protein n=1 Tax=Halomontanus rarus TaxID=3034020 RepID=UPI001A98C318
MEEPRWTELVDILYQDLDEIANSVEYGGGVLRIPTNPENDDLQHLLQKTGHSGEDELKQTLESMESVGLINKMESIGENGEAYAYSLTKMGMQVAHDRSIRRQQFKHDAKQREKERCHREEVAEQQREVTRKTGGYTLFLVLAVATQALVASLEIPGWQGVLTGIIIFLIVILVVIELFSYWLSYDFL